MATRAWMMVGVRVMRGGGGGGGTVRQLFNLVAMQRTAGYFITHLPRNESPLPRKKFLCELSPASQSPSVFSPTRFSAWIQRAPAHSRSPDEGINLFPPEPKETAESSAAATSFAAPCGNERERSCGVGIVDVPNRSTTRALFPANE